MNNKKLYESIMKNISKLIKHTLNEECWDDEFNSENNVQDSHYTKKNISSNNELKKYINITNKLAEELKNVDPNSKKFMLGFTHLRSYLSAMSTYVNYNMN